MGKTPKKIQTDYTTGGRDISNTAVPLYQKNLNLISEYNSDPTRTIDMYKNKYYTNTANQSDFLTDYNRAMTNKTNANYSATDGGYSSSGQRAYDDAQRYWNDRAARLEDYGVQSAASMAQNYYKNLLNANTDYDQAYNLGKEYSDIEQYNNLVKQNNRLGGFVYDKTKEPIYEDLEDTWFRSAIEYMVYKGAFSKMFAAVSTLSSSSSS